MALQPFVGPWIFFQFLDLLYIRYNTLDRGISKPQGRYLRTGQQKTQNKLTQTSMPQMGFEPTIPAFEREKTVHALDRAASVVGKAHIRKNKNKNIITC
jgi:hypothetical protein